MYCGRPSSNWESLKSPSARVSQLLSGSFTLSILRAGKRDSNGTILSFSSYSIKSSCSIATKIASLSKPAPSSSSIVWKSWGLFPTGSRAFDLRPWPIGCKLVSSKSPAARINAAVSSRPRFGAACRPFPGSILFFENFFYLLPQKEINCEKLLNLTVDEIVRVRLPVWRIWLTRSISLKVWSVTIMYDS